MHFVQPDTLIPELYNPQSLNRYSYVRNNPILYSDPSGHREVEGCGDDGKGACHASDLEIALNEQKLAELEYDPSGQKQEQNAEIAEAIIYGGTELLSSILFEPADWAYSVYHCANGDCSPWMLLGFLPLIPSSAGKHADDVVQLVPASTLHWSQEGVSVVTKGRNAVYVDDLAQDMAQGWRGDPLKVLDIDGTLVSLDNRRLTAAKMLGIDVPVTVTKGTLSDLISVFGRDGIFNQIPIRGTDMIIDMFGGLVK